MPIPRGPEDIRDVTVKLVKGIKLIVMVKDIKSDRYIREEKIDWDDPEARKWLGRLTYYCVTNGLKIETQNEQDAVVKE